MFVAILRDARGRSPRAPQDEVSNILILVKHALDLIRIARLGQCQREQPGGLVRTEIIRCDHAGLLPVVVADDAAVTDARAAHHDGALRGDLGQLLAHLSSRARA